MIEVTELRKQFGPRVALDGMPFTALPGHVTGFAGPNGAGKSTTMRVILGLDRADSGTALVNGPPYRSLKHPLRHLASLLDASALQAGRTARNHLLWLARSQGLPPRRIDEVLDAAGLTGVAGRRAGGVSLGVRQRLPRPPSTRGAPRRACPAWPGAGPAGSPWACGSGSASPRRCSATRRCSCSM